MLMTTNFFIMLAIVVYLAIMLVIGFVYSKRNNSTEDFYLGGRKMGPLVTAMSAEASDMSSWLLMGLPGVAYLSGICDAAWLLREVPSYGRQDRNLLYCCYACCKQSRSQA